MHRTPIRSSESVFLLSQSSSFFSKYPKSALSRSCTMLAAIQVSNLVLHPGVFFSPALHQVSPCDSPAFYFLSHPLLFILIIPVDSKVLITVSSTLAVYLVGLPVTLQQYWCFCQFLGTLLAFNLLMASLARWMSKLFSRPQSSLWHNQLVMKQTYCLLKGPCACLVMSDPLPPHRL